MSQVRDVVYRPLPDDGALPSGASVAGSLGAPEQAAPGTMPGVEPDRPAGVPEHAEHLTAAADGGTAVEGWRWLSDNWAAAAEAPEGWHAVRVPADVVDAPMPFVVTDVDSTLIQDEVVELLAAHAGREAEVAEVTERAMRGELDFAQSLHARVEALGGLPVAVIEEVVARVRPTPGARDLIAAVTGAGGRIYAVSGGFTQVLAPLAAAWGLSGFCANELEIADGHLTGRVAGSVVDRAVKEQMLRQWAAEAEMPLLGTLGCGDGANDIDLLTASGCGVALCGKPALREVADACVDVPHLAVVRWMLGL